MKRGSHVPILPYILYVGAALLALLFVADAGLPQPELRSEPVQHHPEIRIASDTPGPDPISFSGPTVDYGAAPPALRVLDLAARATDTRTQAFAQATEQSPQAKPQRTAKATPQRSRKRYYARRVAPPPAQQSADIWSWPRFDVVSAPRF